MYLVVIWTLVISRLWFLQMQIFMTFTFFSLQICMQPAFQGTDFTSFSWLDLIFLVCSIYVYWIFAHVILASLHDCVSYFTFIVLFQHIQIMCVWFLFQFLIFIFCYFEFHVVVNVKVNIQNFLKLSGALHGLATNLYIIYYIKVEAESQIL